MAARQLLAEKPPKPSKLAIVHAAYGEEGAGTPWEVLEDALCQRYHCLPSALDEEDAGRVLRNAEAGNLKALMDAFVERPESVSGSGQQLIGELLTLEAEEDAG